MDAGNPFHAVILDLTIPGGMGGAETIEHLMDMDPDVKVIVASGYADDSVVMNYQDYGFKGAMSKPYRLKDLQTILNAVLRKD